MTVHDSASNQVATDVPYESTIYRMHRYLRFHPSNILYLHLVCKQSVNEMARIATAAGIEESEARKVATQIRKGGPLHAEWKAAFSTGRFAQMNGRPRKASADGRPALAPAVVVSKDTGILSSSSSSATCVDADENVDGAQFLSDVDLDTLNMDDSALMDEFLC